MKLRRSNLPKLVYSAVNISNRQKEFLRYVVSGGTATIANLAAIWLSRWYVNYEIAVAIGAIIGTGTTYLLTKIFVFKSKSKNFDFSEIIRFLSVHAVVCIQIWLVSVLLEKLLEPYLSTDNIRESIASLIGVGSVVFTGFFLHRYVTFRATLN